MNSLLQRARLLSKQSFGVRSTLGFSRFSSSLSAGSTELSMMDSTIGQCLERAAHIYGSNTAVISSEQQQKLNYSELNSYADKLASSFLELGIKKGDRLGMWSPNNLEWVITQYATAKAGIILVNVNPAYKHKELEYALNLVGCKALVMAPSLQSNSNYVEMIQKIAPEIGQYGKGFTGEVSLRKLPELKHIFILGDQEESGMMKFNDFVDGAGNNAWNKLQLISKNLNAHEAINIQFTSGTTGHPKGATLTHHNILNNGYFTGTVINYTEEDKVCITVPLYHCFGMVLGNLACLAHGSTAVLPSAVFNPLQTLQVVEKERCTSLYGVPTMFVAMLNHPDFSQFDISSLRTGIMAGSLCPEVLMKQVVDKMHMTDFTIGYGMTELSPIVTQTRPSDSFAKKTQTIGTAHPHIELKVVDSNNIVLPRGEIGEICARGYGVMQGYWNEPEKTKEAIDDGGWMHTGDLGIMDKDGYLLVTGRMKDMIIRGGENIYPKEIEDCLLEMEQIEDAQVFGIPDDFYGEVVCCWAKAKDGYDLTEQHVKDYCTQELANFKVPKHVKIVNEFPMTVTGKIQKFVMRELMEKGVQN